MYKIIGADGREYGPVPLEQIRQWINEGRVNAQTQVLVEGATDWKPLAAVPELASAIPPGPMPMTVPPVVSSVEAENLAATIVARDYVLDIGGCFGRGWQLVKAHFWLTVGASAIVLLLSVAIGSVPLVGWPASLALNYVLFGGLDWLFLKLIRGERAEVSDAFVGFSVAFVQLLLFSLVSQVLTSIGVLLCILPGIYLSVVWLLFPALLILDKRFEFWAAMECSRKVVSHHWWTVFGFALLGALLLFLGLLACGIGLFVTLPVVTAATVYAYEDIFGRGRTAPAGGTLLPVAPPTAPVPEPAPSKETPAPPGGPTNPGAAPNP